jgi:hypothetical protein
MVPRFGLLVVLLLHYNVLVLASPNTKRDNPGVDLINTLVNDLGKGITAATEIGNSLLEELLTPLTGGSYTIPQSSTNPLTRELTIDTVRTNFLYGPPLAGGPYYPSGILGIAKNALDVVNIQTDLTPELALAALDDVSAVADISKVRPACRNQETCACPIRENSDRKSVRRPTNSRRLY